MEVGRVALDDPDIGASLAFLRGSALGLEPRGVTTKLVIPNSQIRYMTLPRRSRCRQPPRPDPP